MIFKNKKIQKIISSLLVIAVLAPSLVFFVAPKKVNASGTPVLDFLGNALKYVGNLFTHSTAVSSATTASYAAKEWYELILEQVLQAVARKALQEITKSTVNWINSGFHGSPLFLENSDSFFQDIVKSEIKSLVNEFGYDSSRFPFGKDFSLNTIMSYKRTLDDNAVYTLSKVTNDPALLRAYQNNFNVGGWNAFLLNTQYPQNNYLGFKMLAEQELARRISASPGAKNAITKVKEALQQGNGFLSPQTCPSNPAYNNGYNEFNKPSFKPSADYNPPHPYPADDTIGFTAKEIAENALYDQTWQAGVAIEKTKFEAKNTCPKGLVATTPGAVVSNQITNALGSQLRQSELGAALGNSLSQIFDALLNKLLDEGLNALASKTNPDPEPDNWSYGGLRLDGSDGTSDDPFAGFDEIVSLKQFRKLLDGYFIGTCSNIKDSNGNDLADQENVPKEQCESQSITGYSFGTCSGIKVNGIQYPDQEGIPRTTCDAIPGATWTKVGTIYPNTTTWTRNSPPLQDYIPGDIANTEEEIALLDNGQLTSGSASSVNPNSIGTCTGEDQIGSYTAQTTQSDCTAIGGVWTPTYSSSSSGLASSSGNANLGILQLVKLILEKTITLDQCIPGPDKGWEDRLKAEQSRVGKRLTDDMSDDDPLKVKASNDIMRELKFAVDSFKDWISFAMIGKPAPKLPNLSLPNSVIYIDEVKKIDDLPQQSKEVTDTVRVKRQTLARLEALKANLETISDNIKPLEEPTPKTAYENQLISLWKQYKALRASISSTNSIENTRNQRTVLEEWSNKLEEPVDPNDSSKGTKGLIPECLTERTTMGWDAPDPTGKGNSKLTTLTTPQQIIKIYAVLSTREGNSTASIIGGLTGGLVGSILGGLFGTETIEDRIAEIEYPLKGTENEQFCGLPIINGYSHGEVIRQDSSNELITTNGAVSGGAPVPCDSGLDNTSPTDPVSNSADSSASGSGGTRQTGFCGSIGVDPTGTGTSGGSSGTFIGTGREQFTFRNQAASYFYPNTTDPITGEQYAAGTNGYTNLPMVNAQYVYGDITTTGVASWGIGLGSSKDERISIDIDCNTVFKANRTDYTHAGDPSF